MLYPPDLRNRRPFGATANPRGALGALRTFIEQVAPPPASTAPLDNGAVFRLLPGQPAQLREGLTMPQMEPVLEQAAPEVLVRAGRDLVSSRSDAPPPWSAKIPQPRHDPRGALVRALGLSAAGLGLVATAAEGPNGRGTVPALLAGVAQGAQGVVEGIDAEAVRRSNGFLEGIRRQAETEQERAERERRETAATERRAAELAGTQAGDLLDAGEFDRARALLIASNWSDADADALIAARRARRQEEVERENRRDAPDGLTPADLRAERDNVREDARELAEFGDVDGAITLLTGANIYTPERAETVARGWQNDAEVDRRTRARLSRPPAPSGGRSAGRRPASSGIRTTRT
ncbi:MAG TPA: hypothetical protein VK610_08495, partial [Rhodothermales bacterium]|nr:hypothetical protein [Rhodothermales bacterium]